MLRILGMAHVIMLPPVIVFAVIYNWWKGPDYTRMRYDELVVQAQTHCNERNGDVFRPYGVAGWMTSFSKGRTRVFKCYRYRKYLNKNIAIYKITGSTKDDLQLEIR